jgi:tetratricopeptide (TPR) repeat protein
MICAGWVASRMTLRERLATVAVAHGPVEPRLSIWRPLGAVAIVVVAFAVAWSALQPVRSVHAQAAEYDRIDQGQLDAAASIAQIAHERNPLAVEPLFDLSAIEQARRRPQPAVRALEQAVDLEPANPETWRRLGRMRLTVLKDPKGALSAFRAALYLDPRSLKAISDVVVASRALEASGG